MATQTPDACLSVDFIALPAYFAATSTKEARNEMVSAKRGEIATRQQALPTGAKVDALSVATNEVRPMRMGRTDV